MSLGLVGIDRGDMPLHTVLSRRQGLKFDRQDVAVLQRCWLFSLVHTSATGVGYLNRAEQRLHRFRVSQIQRRRGTRHLRPHSGGSTVKECVGKGATGAQHYDEAGGGQRRRSFQYLVPPNRGAPNRGLPRELGRRSSRYRSTEKTTPRPWPLPLLSGRIASTPT